METAPLHVDADRVLTPTGWTGPARVVVSGGTISAVEQLPDDAPTTGRWLVPGFVDLQVNGIDDIDVATADGPDWDRLDALLLAQGVTSWCPTLVTMPLSAYSTPLARIGLARERDLPGRPQIIGSHLEGPFVGGAPGAHPTRHLADPDLGWIAALPAHVALMTIAPERDGAVEAVRALAERDVVVALGHTRSAAGPFDAAVDAGARLVTHLFNGMSGIHHREPGVAAFALADERVACSLIADGVHLDPRVLRIAFAALGRGRAVLVTDAVAWRAGTVSGIGIELRDGAPRLPDGTLAGSAVTMDAAVRQCVSAGVALEDALYAASAAPAAVLGLTDRGAVEPGRRADLVALSPALEVVGTWVAGVPS